MSQSRLARNAAASIIQVIVSALALLLMYRMMMHWLSIEQIGLWSLVIGSTTVARLSEFGIGTGVLRFVASDLAQGDPKRAARSIGMAAILIGTVLSLVTLALQPLLMTYLLHASPVQFHGTVRALLPAAISVVVLGSIGNVFVSALDGCQRMDLRSAIQTLGSLVQLLVTWIVLPIYGANGLGWAQVAQSVVLLLCCGGVVFVRLGQPLSAYFGIDRPRLKHMFSYGGGLQLIGIAQMLFEPMVKVLLTAFSGMALTGYFDMANKILLQFRSLIVAGYSALVPHMAARNAGSEQDRIAIRTTYRESGALLLLVVLPYFAVMAAGLPLALTLWKGHFDHQFIVVGITMLVGWLINTFNPPAYFIYVAIGRLRWNILSQTATGVAMAMLGPVMGYWLGGYGVLLAAVAALALGSIVVIAIFHHEFDLGIAEFLPASRLAMLGLNGLAIAGSAWIARNGHYQTMTWMIILPAAVGAMALLLSWMDPYRPYVLTRMAGVLARVRKA